MVCSLLKPVPVYVMHPPAVFSLLIRFFNCINLYAVAISNKLDWLATFSYMYCLAFIMCKSVLGSNWHTQVPSFAIHSVFPLYCYVHGMKIFNKMYRKMFIWNHTSRIQCIWNLCFTIQVRSDILLFAGIHWPVFVIFLVHIYNNLLIMNQKLNQE